jgi:septal ring factor EnvC (AmiA/AmiB activator)
VETLRETANDYTSKIAERDQQLDSLRKENAAAGSPDDGRLGELENALEQAKQERDQLTRQLVERDHRIETLEEECRAAESRDENQDSEWQQRLDMAVGELRQLRKENQELSEKLSKASATGSHAPPPGGFDWETQKRILLEQLENDFNPQGEEPSEARLTVEGAIQITDQVVAEKENEIAELKRLLDQQTENIGSMAVGAQALAEILDQDELIQSERQMLKQMQDEWKNKLREAELEISVERAKLARERAQLEDAQRSVGAARATPSEKDSSDVAEASKQPRRWLARLGLKEE